MTIDTFTPTEFEATLPPGWRYVGLDSGERVYRLPTVGAVEITIRSSIRADGQSAGTAQDSIRLWLVTPSGAPVSQKVAKYISRVPGWAKRMNEAIETLRHWRQLAGDCPTCGKPKSIAMSSTAKNPNRTFAKCWNCDSGFEWLDSPWSQPYFTPEKPSGQAWVKPSDSPLVNSLTLKGQALSPLAPAPAVAPTGPLAFLSSAPAIRLDREPEVESSGQTGVTFTPSKYQSDVFDFVSHGTGHGLIDAKAGSGKTTTEEKAIAYTPRDSKVIYLAFNKRIVLEAEKRMPERCKTATTHSQAFSNVRKAFGSQVKVEERKTYNIIRSLTDRMSWQQASVVDENAPAINQLVGLVKNTLGKTDDASLERMCDYYAIEVNGSAEVIYQTVRSVLIASREMRSVIDFDDMLLYAADGTVPCEQFDYVFIDEAQDLNRAQIEFVLKSVRPGGRIVAVGDEKQSCYAFRGADIDAIQNIVKALDATVLPLSICYRCPQSHVRLAQTIVPAIEWRPNAPEGVIANIPSDQLLGHVKPGSMVICRTNAPLIRPAFELIRSGVKAVIVGRDIGRGLSQLVHKVSKKSGATGMTGLLSALFDYTQRETGKLLAAHKDNQASQLQDQTDTISALADGCQTLEQLDRKIDAVFSDSVQGVAFSSIHRAKGLEANEVFLLHPELLPHPMAKSEWAMKQESNLKYIAYTRSKSELYFVSGE